MLSIIIVTSLLVTTSSAFNFASRPGSFYFPLSLSSPNIARLSMASPTSGNVAALPSLVLTPQAAERSITAALDAARRNNWTVTVCVSDAGGNPIVARRDNGGDDGGPLAFAASYDLAVGKARSAALFGRATSGLEGAANVTGGEGGRTALLSAPYILIGGGLPVVASNGVVVGSVGVSGVKPDQDEVVAQAGVDALEGMLRHDPISRL
jgi:glc operon protein GlcG